MIQTRYSLAYLSYIFLPCNSRAKAKLLAKLISDFSELFEVNPKAVKHVPIHPFAGVPLLGSIFKGDFAVLYVFDSINLK